MQVSQRLRIIEPPDLGHEALNELQNAVGAIDKAAQNLAGIRAFLAVATFVKESLGPRGVFGGREIKEGQKITRLVVGALLLELLTAFQVDQG